MPPLWPLFLIVGSNLVYQTCSKCATKAANPFAILTATYFVAMTASFVIFCATEKGSVAAQFRAVNWAGYLLGLAIIGLEGGFLFLYRVGWKASVGPVLTYTAVAIGLLILGALLWHEHVGWKQILGTVLCLAGIALVSSR